MASWRCSDAHVEIIDMAVDALSCSNPLLFPIPKGRMPLDLPSGLKGVELFGVRRLPGGKEAEEVQGGEQFCEVQWFAKSSHDTLPFSKKVLTLDFFLILKVPFLLQGQLNMQALYIMYRVLFRGLAAHACIARKSFSLDHVYEAT